jgi:excisionase family DNA binding protein
MKLLLTTAEACEALGIRKTKLFELMRDGAIERRQLGGRTAIPAESLRAFADSLPRIEPAPRPDRQPAPAEALPAE